MKKIIAAFVAAPLFAMLAPTAAEANVNTDSTHCVGDYKFNHAPFGASRAEVEKFFNTTGLGVKIDNGDDGKTIMLWSYRWCGKVPKQYSARYIQTEYKPGEGLVSVTRASIVK